MIAVAHLTVQNIAMELTVCIDAPIDARGDVSFERLVAIHEPAVRRLAHRLLGWRESTGEVDDVVQDVFLAALKSLGKFRGEASISTWLMRVTINRCRTHRRKQLLRFRWLLSQKPPANAPAANERPAADETSELVRTAVQKLPSRDREVIVLFYLEELPAAEIGKLLGISSGAVDVRLHRARAKLRQSLDGVLSDDK